MMWARREAGFTLVELLVTMTISFIVFGATLSVLQVFQTDSHLDQQRLETQDNARNAIDRLARELRNVAAPSPTYLGALELAEPNSLTFETIDSTHTWGGENVANAIRVRYCLDDSNPSNEVVWRQVMSWTGKEGPPLPSATTCPDLNASDWNNSAQLVQHVTNRNGGQTRALFAYGPPGATEVAKIVSVEPNVYIDLNPGHARPGESQLTSSITLRNTNRQPAAAFTATESGPLRAVILNASESSDPGGLALSYKWWDNSTLLPSSAQKYVTAKNTLGSTHTFKLEVTNPGGLSNSTEKVVKIE
jgi:prepilin-type N-terminal cleavage/methylation domain-containing protein